MFELTPGRNNSIECCDESKQAFRFGWKARRESKLHDSFSRNLERNMDMSAILACKISC